MRDSTILLVDDNSANLQLLRMILSDEGYSVRVATSGTMALETINVAIPDLILLDIKMPGMDGYEICRLLKADKIKKRIPILFISAQYSVEDETKGLELGAVDYIVKPIRAPIVLARVKMHLENYMYKEHLEKEVKARTAELEHRMDKLNHEIFERKQAEKEIQRTKAILAKAEHMGNIGSWEYENIKKKPYWSDELYLIFGLKAQELEASNDSYAGYIHPDDREMVFKAYNDSLKTKKPYDIVHRFQLQDDSIKYVNVKCETVFDKDDNPLKSIGMVRDISEEHKLQDQLNHKSKMDAIGQLAGGIAHDFNNVLSGILSASQLLKLPKHRLNEKSLSYVDMIIQASIRASDLISKLLAFSRKDEMTTTTLDIHQILDNTVDILQRTIDKKITIALEKDAHNFNIIGDISAIESAFINLGINASHAMSEGGEIQIKTRNIFLDQKYCDSRSFEITPGDFIQIEIKDTGSGIPKENLQKIFEPFYTTKEQGTGTGLGLSAVYGTIQDHHGIIEVHSIVGTGTTFYILLPCSRALIEQVKEINPILKGIGTILLVDDEKINRILNKDILESLGYRVLLAEDGLKSIEIFSKNHSEIDIVLMDMIMPKMNGSEAFYRMREIDEKCKIIISSGYTRNENIEELIKNGMAGFINKPYNISEISQVLDKVQNQKQN